MLSPQSGAQSSPLIPMRTHAWTRPTREIARIDLIHLKIMNQPIEIIIMTIDVILRTANRDHQWINQGIMIHNRDDPIRQAQLAVC